jgi:ribosomal protein S18 acetylase RimI-like enzyme
MDDVQVRRARADDREGVLAFCARTWDDGDYIADVWDRWLADPRSVLLVGVRAERPVALVKVHLLNTEEGWIEGLRVDSTQRRQGLGRSMLLEALLVARDLGLTVVRLFTDANNHAAQSLFVATGFEHVATFVSYQAPAEADGPADLHMSGAEVRTPGVDELERLWAFLEASSLAPLSGGLLIERWRARALTTVLLEQRLATGDVWTLDAWGMTQALAIVEARPHAQRGPYLAVQYVDGALQSIGPLALALRGEAVRRALTTVTALTPDTLMLRDAMDGAGYSASDHSPLFCFAHTLPRRTSPA